jgi:hypothetical protein
LHRRSSIPQISAEQANKRDRDSPVPATGNRLVYRTQCPPTGLRLCLKELDGSHKSFSDEIEAIENHLPLTFALETHLCGEVVDALLLVSLDFRALRSQGKRILNRMHRGDYYGNGHGEYAAGWRL